MPVKIDKQCYKCGIVAPHKIKKSGRVNSYCLECQRKYDREWHQANRELVNPRKRSRKREHSIVTREWVNELKSGSCLDCKLEWPPYVMEFDHIRGEKLFNIGDAVGQGYSRETILAEIAKCDLVCANCHRIRTFTRKN